MNNRDLLIQKQISLASEKIKIAKEQKLRFLDLSGLHLYELPEDISDMTYLMEIDLSYNQLSILPHSITQLENLQYLNLSNNYLTQIDFEFGRNYAIRELNISNNNLNFIPESLNWFSDIQIIYHNNPFLSGIPGEMDHQDFYKVKHFLELIKDSNEVHRFYETKLIFVGRGEVGKTTLMKVLKDQSASVELGKEPTTHGINIDSIIYNIYFPAKSPHYNSYNDIENVYRENDYEEWKEWNDFEDDDFEDDDFEPLTSIMDILHQFDEEYHEEIMFSNNLTQFDDYVIEKQVKINLWDFGGQEIYYSTHQFFLTKRSIYIFVWEPRKDDTEEEFDYWLNTIKLLGSESPILVVMNKSDIRYKNIDKKNYEKKFENIVGFYNVSCISKEGIDRLKQEIETSITNLPHIGDKLPSSWITLREKIRSINSDYISYSEFVNTCLDTNPLMFREEITFLSEYLHDIGDIIHFKEDSILRNIVIINPQWATKAVYQLINTIQIQKNNGKFDLINLESYWDTNIYPIEKHIELLQLMEKFQICFKLIGAQNVYIIPELLETEIPNISVTEEILNNDPLRFQIEYKFMPIGMLTRLICKIYYLIYKENYWKNGAVFVDDMSKAIVQENRIKKTIEIAISGKQKFNLLAIIRNELNNIHMDFNMVEKETYNEKIPCICNICKNNSQPYFFDFKVLKNFISKDKYKIDCHISANSVDIYQLISGYNLIKPNKKIIHHILTAVSQLQGQNKNIIPSEDSRNSFISGRLSSNGIFAKDQSKWGMSGQGVNQGELDIKIEDGEGNIVTIFEGLNLKFIDKNVLGNHLEKIILKYDPNGLFEKFLVIYYDGSNFDLFNKKYLKFIEDYSYKDYRFIEIFDESEDILQHTEIKVFKSTYIRSSKQVSLYHILLNLS